MKITAAKTVKTQAQTEEHRRPNPKVVRRALAFLRPYRLQWTIVLLLTVATTGISLAFPWIRQLAIDDGISAGNYGFLMRMVWATLALSLAGLVFGMLQGQILTRLGQDTIHDLRVALFSHLTRLSLDFYEEEQPGRVISRAINDLDAISELITGGVVGAVTNLIVLVGVTIIMFSYNAAIAGMVLVLMPILLLLGYLFQNKVREIFRRSREALAAVTSYLHETVTGVRVVKSLSREKKCDQEFAFLNAANMQAGIDLGKVFSLIIPAGELSYALAICIVFGYGGMLVARGEMQVGVVIALLFYVGSFFEPIRRLMELIATVPRALVGFGRIIEILDREPSIQDLPTAKQLPPFQKEVEFRNVTFSYNGSKPVLKDVNLKAHFGEMIALVGKTGAGKSTMVKLLTRMYDTKEGEILIDGHRVSEVTQDSLRGQMGMVQQETFLFAGTVRENIRYGRPGATDEEIEAAAKMVHAHDFIMRLPEGYDTDISERGIRLSGGQRQLVSFARAVLRNPRILILDEATSSVDHFTEAHIQEAMNTLLKDRVSFVIAHRISTVRDADQILLLDDGEVIARGRHEELATISPLYRSLYERRFAEEEQSE